jgi:rubrerythrin
VRNLIAAGEALPRGQFNVTKTLRAAAHTQRTLALNACRLLNENHDASALFETILGELERGLEMEEAGSSQADPTMREALKQCEARSRLQPCSEKLILRIHRT